MLFLVLAEAKMSSFKISYAQKFKIQIQTKRRIREEELKTEKSKGKVLFKNIWTDVFLEDWTQIEFFFSEPMVRKTE